MSKPASPVAILRDCRSLYLKRLTETLLVMPDLSQADIKVVARGAGEFFDNIIEQAQRGGFIDEAKGLTSSLLTLVTDDELALSIRLDTLGSRLYEAVSDDLWKPYRRFAALLGRPDLPADENPISPEGIAEGLEQMFKQNTAFAGEERDEVIDRLEEHLREQLPAVYRDIENFLDNTGVEAAQACIVTGSGSGTLRGTDQPDLMGSLAALNKALISRLTATAGDAGLATAGAAVAPLGKGGTASPTSRIGPQGIASRPPTLDQLCSQLDALEQAKGQVKPSSSGNSSMLEDLIPDLFAKKTEPVAIPGKITAASLGISGFSPEGMAVDMLSAIFDAIQEAPQIPDGLKSVVQLLRVSIIKQALHHPELINESNNPWQALLDTLAALFRTIPFAADAKHPVLAKVLDIVNTLRRDPNQRQNAFATAQAALEVVLRERQPELQRIRETYLPLFDILEKYDWARKSALARMARIQDKDIPKEFRFFKEIWLAVLERAWLHGGPESREWAEYSSLFDDLLWSFDAAQAANNGAERITRIPDILRRLRSGLEYTQQPAELQSKVFTVCFALQAKAVKPQTVVPNLGLPAASDGSDARAVVVRKLKFAAGWLQLIDYRTPFQPMPEVPGCSVGDCLMLHIGKTQRHFYFLHLAENVGRALLWPLDNDVPLLIHMGILSNQLQGGRAKINLPTAFYESVVARALADMES